MPGRLRDPGPRAKDAERYKALRAEPNGKGKSARLANAAARMSREGVGRTGGTSGDDEEWTVADLRRKAAQIGIAGRSTMRKGELISALRHH
jgi:hypothetical protein